MYLEGRKLDKGDIYILADELIGVLVTPEAQQEDCIRVVLRNGSGTLSIAYKYLDTINNIILTKEIKNASQW